MEIIVQNEQGMILELKEHLHKLFPSAEKVFIRTQFPDILVHFENGKTLGYEIEYRLGNFFKHRHHRDKRACHGIIFWIDDRIEEEISNERLKNYDLICIGKEKSCDLLWIDEYLDVDKEQTISLGSINASDSNWSGIFTVSEVMKRLEVTRQTVYKWLDTVIPHDEWFRLPGGHIRIEGSALKKIANKEI